MAKTIKSINEISGQKIDDNNLLMQLLINPICQKHVGFIKSKVFKDESRYSYNIVLEFKKNTEVMNKLDNTIEKIEREITVDMPTFTFETLNFYIIYK